MYRKSHPCLPGISVLPGMPHYATSILFQHLYPDVQYNVLLEWPSKKTTTGVLLFS